ncbi:unnamed protein product [Mytilus edulis]|uniref:Uncharacterized protein n=1 Tax=Mytilus edulis TaxID=6550 RepID=A0A8S3QIL0_MYTED|nr:unnamed protein product [Mytilus edulis]
MATGGIPRRLNCIEEEEPSSRITPDAQGPQLPASTMDLTMDNMVDVTPSGEVQMRVTRGIYRQDESLNGDQSIETARCRTQKEKDSNYAKITDEEQLTRLRKTVVDSADQEYDSSRNLNRNNFDVRLNTINLVTKSQVNDQDNVKAKRPPLYDGISSWQDHLVQFEMIALKNNWSESTKAYEIATSLKGDVRGIVTDLEPEMRLDYKYLVAELTSRFEPANQANMYKAQMNSLFRKQGQALPELAQEIKRITRLAYPTAPIDIRDQLAKDCFIRALNDTKIQLTLFNRELKTIHDCEGKFDALPPEVKSLLKINKRKLYMANGDSIPTLGTIDLPVEDWGSSITQKFTVAEIDAPAVLGFEEGISTDTEKIETVKSWPSPKNIKEVKVSLGTCSYYRRFIKDFVTIAKPLHKLTEKNVQYD